VENIATSPLPLNVLHVFQASIYLMRASMLPIMMTKTIVKFALLGPSALKKLLHYAQSVQWEST
jgi:hypothetical protein